jgi:hypothetical protein
MAVIGHGGNLLRPRYAKHQFAVWFGTGTTFSGCCFENLTFCAIATGCWARR